MEWNGMEQFEGFEKLKKMKNGNGMEREKWISQTKGQYISRIKSTNMYMCWPLIYH